MYTMTRQSIIFLAAILIGLLHLRATSGSSIPKKIQIRVPHNIQHHHHTHTKYHFITLPAKPKELNNTGVNTFQGLFPLMPVMPIVPGVTQAANVTTTTTTTTTTPAPAPVNPQQGFQTNALPGAAPVNPQQGFQANAFPTAGIPLVPAGPGMMTASIQPNRPNGPGTPFMPQQSFIPLVLARPSAMYTQSNGYDYVDNIARRSQKYFKVEPVPTQATPQTMKFKTVINVHETKKIPLTDLLNIANLLQPEPPRRVKVEVMPEKNTYVKQKISDSVSGSIKHYSLPDVDAEGLHFDPETAAYQMESRKEVGTLEKPEWKKVKELLERHIHEDFPGLKINAELVPLDPAMKERTDSLSSVTAEIPSVSINDLKHIGYVVIDDNNERKFIPLTEEQR